MIRYPLQEKETLHDAIVHASMMAGAEAQGGARDIRYVIVCRKCSAARIQTMRDMRQLLPGATVSRV